jgi:hypothetical protein
VPSAELKGRVFKRIGKRPQSSKKGNPSWASATSSTAELATIFCTYLKPAPVILIYVSGPQMGALSGTTNLILSREGTITGMA